MSELNADALKAAEVAFLDGPQSGWFPQQGALHDAIRAYLAALPKQEPSGEVPDYICDDIIGELDIYARNVDRYEYGLPASETRLPAMREIIRKELKRIADPPKGAEG